MPCDIQILSCGVTHIAMKRTHAILYLHARIQYCETVITLGGITQRCRCPAAPRRLQWTSQYLQPVIKQGCYVVHQHGTSALLWTNHLTNCRCKAANKRGNEEAARGNLKIKRFMAIPCVNMPLQRSVMMRVIIVIMQDADNSDNARCSLIKLMVCTDCKYSEQRDNDAVYDDWQKENVTNQTSDGIKSTRNTIE